MPIKTSELNARLFGKVDKRRASSTQEARKAVSEKVPIIELSVAGETIVEFQLMRIPAADIVARTLIFSGNAREQTFLNELALSDILVTLKDRGQQYPAVGRWVDDEKIEVLDGSRRRMSCILAGQDFLIYVANGINSKHAKFLSDVANAHKPLSLYERGKEMQTMLDTGDVVDQKELAKVCQCSEALVSGALKAAALPIVLLQAYPSVGELGRPTIVKLHRLFFSLNDSEQEKILTKLRALPLWQSVGVLGISRITREVSLIIETWCDELKPKTYFEDVPSVNLVKGCASYRRKGEALSINLKKINDIDAEAILQFIKEQLS